ncbi:hypothetical protein [Pragia fontium]|uniref:hypothetical protein n=1 Tax=Pragia fontium TaxID=82985 RepID=UPI000F70F0C8|nr:hypothetical protein [Pragia fontium]VEJ54580.1 Uncharacterised protein [Pragia fontium]
MTKQLEVTMPDNSVWAVPVSIIARHRAEYYAHEFSGDIGRSLAEDTMILFNSDPFEIKDWAANNMNWSSVQKHASLISKGETDYEEGWANGEKCVVEI